MKRIPWQLRLGIALVVLSAAFYAAHWMLFHDLHHILIYLVGDIAFVPIEVLLVTLIIHELLAKRERRAKMSKLNMVIGAFFSEVGTRLLSLLAAADGGADEMASALPADDDRDVTAFKRFERHVAAHDFSVDPGGVPLEELRSLLREKKEFILGLLQNPNLMEHEAFTDLLWATTHLAEELDHRDSLADIPEPDRRHLAGDARRTYRALARQWCGYLGHLRDGYPYLYSLAVRLNPFDPAAVATIGGREPA